MPHEPANCELHLPIDRKAQTLRRVLFLSEENVHANRFCEELLNSFARTEGLNWQATSRGVLPVPARHRVEPMSPAAIAHLRALALGNTA